VSPKKPLFFKEIGPIRALRSARRQGIDLTTALLTQGKLYP